MSDLPPAGSTPEKKRGCWFYGCVTLAIVGLLCVVVGIFVARWALGLSARLIEEFTDTAPMQIEMVMLSPEEKKALEDRLAAFQLAMDNQKEVRELVLTARELNGLIAENKDLKGKLFVMIEGDRIKGKVSVPLLKDIGPFKVKGRYLNGTAAFKVSLAVGTLDVALDEMEVKGKPLPATVMKEFGKKNLAEDVHLDPKNAQRLERFESIQIKDDKVILRNKVNKQ
ncbi:MAG TPA: hypothetical protein VGK40_10655 [Verrucomicrobiae bacterium]